MKLKILAITFLISSAGVSIYYFIRSDGNFANVYWAYYFQTVVVSIIAIYELFTWNNKDIERMTEEAERQKLLLDPNAATSTSPVYAMKTVMSIAVITFMSMTLIPSYLVIKDVQAKNLLPKANSNVVLIATILFTVAQIAFIMIRKTNNIFRSQYKNASDTSDLLSKIMFKPIAHQLIMVVALNIASLSFLTFNSETLFISFIATATFAEIIVVIRTPILKPWRS